MAASQRAEDRLARTLAPPHWRLPIIKLKSIHFRQGCGGRGTRTSGRTRTERGGRGFGVDRFGAGFGCCGGGGSALVRGSYQTAEGKEAGGALPASRHRAHAA